MPAQVWAPLYTNWPFLGEAEQPGGHPTMHASMPQSLDIGSRISCGCCATCLKSIRMPMHIYIHVHCESGDELRKFCSMHVCNLGIWQTLVAEGILHLCEYDPDQTSLEKSLRRQFLAFKAWRRQSHIACSQRVFTPTNMHLHEQYAWLNAKAFNCRILAGWLAD